jgi:hypothetical protein
MNKNMETITHTVDSDLDNIYRRAEKERKQAEAARLESREVAAGLATERYRDFLESSRAAQEVGLGSAAIHNLVGVSGRHATMGWSEQRRLGLGKFDGSSFTQRLNS